MLGLARTPLVLACLAVVSFSSFAQTGATQKNCAEADAAYSEKRYANALAAYRIVAESSLPESTRARALTRVGYCLYRLGDRPAARAAWESVPDRFPTQIDFACDALLRAGNVAAAAQDYEGAIADYRRASDDYADNAATREARETAAESLCRLGSAYVNRAEKDKSSVPAGGTIASAWQAASGNFGQAEMVFERVARQFPDCSEWAAEAEMQLVAITYEKAFDRAGKTYFDVVEAADKFLRAFPGDTARLATVHLLRAEALHEDGKPSAALPDLDLVLTTHSTAAGQAFGQAQFMRAKCLYGIGDMTGALEEFGTFLRERRPC